MKHTHVKNELINSILSGIALILSIGLNVIHWFSLFEVMILIILTIAFGKNISQYIAEKKFVKEKML